MNIEVSNKIRELRNARELSQEKLAQEIGMTKDYISRIERGEVDKPSFDTISKLAKLFEVPLETFLPNE